MIDDGYASQQRRCAQALKHRTELLEMLLSLATAGAMGTHDKGDGYAEVDVKLIRRAKTLWTRITKEAQP